MRTPFILALALALPLAGPVYAAAPAAAAGTSAATADAALLHLAARYWRQTAANDPFSASLNGVHDYDDRWADPSLAQERRFAAQLDDDRRRLAAIDRSRLSPARALDATVLAYELDDTLAGLGQADRDAGLISQLWGPQLVSTEITQLRFDGPIDYDNYLKRLQRLPAYLQAYQRRLAQAAARGITPPRVVLQRVPGEIAGQIAQDPAASPFYAPFKTMPSTMSPAQQAGLRAQAQRLIAAAVNPAYRRFGGFFSRDYLPKTRQSIGAATLPGGAGYYAYLVRHYTTTEMTPTQVHELGEKQVAAIQAQMVALAAQAGYKSDLRGYLDHLRNDPSNYYHDPQRLLQAYRAAAKKVDPHLVQVLGTWLLPRVPYGVHPIPAALAPNTYPAYSEPPSGDGRTAGYVAVNLYQPESRPIYDIPALMCHEGRPGHQLQIPVAQALDGLPEFRRFAYYNAYGEGWALYAERLCDELGLYDTPASRFGYLDYQMWRAVRLVVDTGIHAQGWSRRRAIDYMRTHTALAQQNIDTEVDRYIAWPGQALAYMVGELTILRLRAQARAALGVKYSLRDFDDVVLGQGSLPLSVLQQAVQRWIDRTKAGLPPDQLPYADRPRRTSLRGSRSRSREGALRLWRARGNLDGMAPQYSTLGRRDDGFDVEIATPAYGRLAMT
ncbi:MAG: DUF885 domain-containing protein [Gammaproteobacteria bacterium]|nr:DUF885 domain-containing protein [Gammaproteobacteria bacterium]